MKDLKAIVEALEKQETKTLCAIATVVRVHGSSYRSPGARMLITKEGKWFGSISGGCLEGDALRKARGVMDSGEAMVVTYDTREESNQNLGIGLGCNGVIDVLIEPAFSGRTQETEVIYKMITSKKHPVALGTIVSGAQIASKILVTNDGETITNIEDRTFTHQLTEDLSTLFNDRKSIIKSYACKGEEVLVFLEFIEPAISLILFGAGFDARPVSEFAKTLGWNVSVTDECAAHIAPVFFPRADNLSLCARQFIARDFEISEYTACVLMSHNYEYDRDVLKTILKSSARYIGILGPRKRFEKIVHELSIEGINLSTEDYDRIHSPIGIDIGAETPDEIAISIVSEIQAKFSNRSGGFLKYRTSPIHRRDTKSDQVLKMVYHDYQESNKSA